MTTKAWSIIDQLAKEKLQEAREKVSLANLALKKITAQKIQLFEMLNDYQSRLNKAQELEHSIDEHVSYRHFIKQVQDLIEVIEDEEHQADQRLKSEEDLLIDALKEKKKTEKTHRSWAARSGRLCVCAGRARSCSAASTSTRTGRRASARAPSSAACLSTTTSSTSATRHARERK